MRKCFTLRQSQRFEKFPFGHVFLALLLCLLSVSLPEANAAQVTLAWDPNSELDLAGYKVYYGTSSRNYAGSRDAGKVISYTFTGLPDGRTLYFAATAYDRYGKESDFSEEVVYLARSSNHAPVAVNGVLSTDQDKAATGSLTATDPDGDSLTFSVVTQGTLGTVAITNAATGACTYTPKAGAKGSDSFTFRAADAGGLSSTATVAVTIVAVNHAPVAQNGSFSTPQGTPRSGVLIATDPDGDSLTFSVVTQGTLGAVAITNAATGACTYTPKAGAKGSDSFTFRAVDAGGLSSTATVAVTIVAVNHAPVAQNGSFSTPQGAPLSGVLIATDPDGDSLTYTLTIQATKGTAVITNAAAGSYTYTPKAGTVGADNFTFQVRDAGSLTSSATVAVTITPVNQAPVAGNGTLSTVQDTPVAGKLTATDADGDALRYSLVSTANLGTVLLNAATGAFTYTPNAGSTGPDTFSFKANDGKADSNMASVTVTVNAHVNIQLEAEQGVRTLPMFLGIDHKASYFVYIYVPNGYGTVSDPLNPGGQAVFSFTVPTAGNYRVWGRVMTGSTNDNSFFVSVDYQPSVAWHTVIGAENSWTWAVVKDRNDAVPSSFALTAGTHSLIIKQMEDGTKLDAIVITTQPAWIPETVYADAESGTIDGWDVFDADPAGAVITNVFDEDRNSHVIQVAGSTTNNGYRLRSNSNTGWANQSQFVIEWSMKYGEPFVIYVEAETTQGYRCFQFEPLSYDVQGSSSQIWVGLGTGAKDGQWHTFVRDLQADLTKAQPGNTILKVNTFSIRGSGRIDDVKLKGSS